MLLGKESQESPGDGLGDLGSQTQPGCAIHERSLATVMVPVLWVGSAQLCHPTIPSGAGKELGLGPLQGR